MQDNLNVIRHVSKGRNNGKLKEKNGKRTYHKFFKTTGRLFTSKTTPKSVLDDKIIQNHRVTSSSFVFLSAKMVQRHTSRERSFEKALAMSSSINTSFDTFENA